MNFRKRQSGGWHNGITLAELMVACVVSITIMGLATSLCFRIRLVYRDIDQQRIALAELSNQMDELTRLSESELADRLVDLSPSDPIEESLKSPVLTGELKSSEIGKQLVLRLDWKRRHPGKPVELVGWLTESISESGEDRP